MLAVSGTEGIVNIAVAEFGELLGKSYITFGLTWIEAYILKKHYLFGLESFSHSLHVGAKELLGKLHRLMDKFGEALCDRLQRECILKTVLRTSEMGNQNNRSSVGEKFFNGG